MKPFGPLEAFTPALARTQQVLFAPFRLGRSWKLAFCAYIALCGSFFFPFPLAYLAFLGMKPAGSGPWFVTLIWVGSLVGTVITLLLHYFGSRMQFVLFDYVATPSQFIAPLWRRYGRQTWSWIWLKFAVLTPIAFVLLLPLYPLFRSLLVMLPRLQASPNTPPDANLFTEIFSAYFVIAAASGLIFLVASALSDFVLPQLAIEEVSAATALRRMMQLFRAEPLTLLGYLGMRFVLAIGGFMAQYIATIVATLAIALVLGLTAFLGWLLFHLLVPTAMLAVGAALLYLAFVACLFWLQLGTFGIVIVFLRAYSLYFFGGRYTILGELVEQPSRAPGQ